MATLIPAYSTCSQRMTAGERRLAQRLEDKLEDDYLLWYDVPVGPKRLHPDFIILHPHRGVIILEVKDWKLSTIHSVNSQTVTLLLSDGEKSVINPLEQARSYALTVKESLERDKLLVRAEGRYKGKLAFPCSYGVVFTNIKRNQFEATEALQAVFDPNLVICQDEFYETVDPIDFQQRLWNLCMYEFGEPLTSVQIDHVRGILFPDIVINHQQLSIWAGNSSAEEPSPEFSVPDILRIMDLQQEQLARSLGDGHRVVHGVAGSGKTLILVYRCLRLAETTTKPILVLCFNVALAAKLRQMLHEKGIGDRVVVRNFHGWCSDLLWEHRISKPSSNQFSGDAYFDALIHQVITAVDAGQIPAGKYGAVLIDEGHDFKPEWLKLTAQMVDPETKALLLLYDDAQNLYGEQRKQKFTFKSVGIQAQGRTTILKLNYRNTQEVLAVAYEFAKEVMMPTDGQEEDAPVLIQPESAGRHGPQPELIRLPNFKHEQVYLVERLQQFHERGTPWNEIAIAYRSKWIGQQLYTHLQQSQIPVEWVNKDSKSRDFKPSEQSVKLVTMHSSKGLEFPIVFIPGIGFMPNQNVPLEEEARLLYVAMTRAIDQLVMTCDRPSAIVHKVEAALSKSK